MANLVVHSIRTRKNVIIMGVLVAFFLLLLAFDLYAWLGKGFFHPMELAFELFVLLLIYERMAGKYTYELGKKSLLITKQGIFGRKTVHEVYYKDIFGVYLYKAKLIGYIKFRKTFRYNSALDGRDVWVVGYEVPAGKGKKHNYRLYIKPTPEMLTELERKMPNKIHGTEEKTIQKLVTEEIESEKQTNNETVKADQ
jgi:hypothetical protein